MQTISEPDLGQIIYIPKLPEWDWYIENESKRMRPPRCSKECLRPELEAVKSHKGVGGKGRYALGYRYCAKCCVYFLPKHLDRNLYCKCCKVRTRGNPQHNG